VKFGTAVRPVGVLHMKLLFCLLALAAGAAYAQEIPIVNFDQVNASLYRGGRPDGAAGIEYLRRLGIKTVISLQGGDLDNGPVTNLFVWLIEKGETQAEIDAEHALTEQAGMQFVNLRINSQAGVGAAEAERIRQALHIMHDPNAQPVFVHCAHGADRTGLVVALYRMIFENRTVAQAWHEMGEHGHGWLATVITYPLDEYLLTTAGLRKLRDMIGLPNPMPAHEAL
jgi:tyrosine-protein phosphatase SIW14